MFASLGTRFHITKYPTLKYMRNGIVAKREYRGQRTVDAFTEFVRQQTEEVVKEYSDLNELKDMDVSVGLGCKFPVSSADFWLCLRKFCGEADRKACRAAAGIQNSQEIHSPVHG